MISFNALASRPEATVTSLALYIAVIYGSTDKVLFGDCESKGGAIRGGDYEILIFSHCHFQAV